MARPHIGIHNLGGAILGGSTRKAVAMAAHLARRYQVTLILDHSTWTAAYLERYFGVDLTGVRLHPLRLPVQDAVARFLDSPLGRPFRIGHVRSLVSNLRRDIAPLYAGQIRDLGLDLFLNNTYASNLPCPAPKGIYMCMFPHPGRDTPRHNYGLLHSAYDALVSRISHLSPEMLDSYTAITANSAFTAEWIQRLWNRPSEVVYSSSTDMGPAGQKDKIILHVGRFSAANRPDHKHQDTLLEAFREMPDLHAAGWQLHFAGSVTPEESSWKMMERLRLRAEGFPIHLHHNLPFPDLRDLYRRASLFWLATGYGTSADEKPAWQEHFGQTTVEALSAGAVPVVIDSGGQKETVDHGRTGFRWSTIAQLQDQTRQLALDPGLRARFAEAAIASYPAFGNDAFVARIGALADSLLLGQPGRPS